MRPGEKLYEETLTEMEGITATRYENIFLAKLEEVNREKLAQGIAELERLAWARDSEGIRRKLKELVPSYQPEGWR